MLLTDSASIATPPTPADIHECKLFVYKSARHGGSRVKLGKTYSGENYVSVKERWPNGKVKFPFWWDVHEEEVANVEDILQVIKDHCKNEVGLMRTCPDLNALLAAGAPGGVGAKKGRTYVQDNVTKHAVKRALYTHTEEPNRILTIDVDEGCPCPAGIDPTSPEAAKYVISQLPPKLRDGSWAYQMSSGSGLESNKSNIKIHLIGIGSIGFTDASMKDYAKAFNSEGGLQIDQTLYDSVHLLYVREPEFINAAKDPFKGRQRHGIIKGKHAIIDTSDIAAFIPDPNKAPIVSKSAPKSGKQVYELASALFENDVCHDTVKSIVGTIVSKYGKHTNKHQVYQLVKKASDKAIAAGKLNMSGSNSTARQYSLSRANTDDLVDRFIGYGFGAKPLPMSNKVKKMSKQDQFSWAMNLNATKGDTLERALTAIEAGFDLIGQVFSPDMLINLILKQYPMDKLKTDVLKNRFDFRIKCVKQAIAPITNAPTERDGVEIIPITDLKAVKAEVGTIVLVSAPMGKGKTRVVAKRQSDRVRKQASFITHRVSLTKDAANVVNLHHYQEKRRVDSEGLVTCVNSIRSADNYQYTIEEAELIIVDEITQVLREVLISRTMQSNRELVFITLAEFVNDEHTMFIGMDANICHRDVEIIRSMTDKPIKLYTMDDDMTGMHAEIINTRTNAKYLPAAMAIDAQEPCIICSDNKHTVTMIARCYR